LELMRPLARPELAAARADHARRAGDANEFKLGGAEGPADIAGGGKAAPPESFRRFEAMVLQTFIQNMLPNDGAAVYGQGMSGDMWKSLLAEKMAEAMAGRGGIGIADRMLGGQYASETRTSATEAKPAAAEIKAGEANGRIPVAPAVLDGMQRALSELIAGELPASTATPVQSIIKRG
jgi:flagellar protein FlgJ